MELHLSEQDKSYIWQVVHHAAESMGGYEQLFASPLEFNESGDRVKFNWPVWMRAIKAYIISRYGESGCEKLLLTVLSEVYNPENYRAYLAKREDVVIKEAANRMFMR